jgi:Acyl-protein synthetase, LuxE
MSTVPSLYPHHQRLLQEATRWAAGATFDPERARQSRRDALLHNHRHYRSRIPLYRQIADRAGVNDDAPFEVLAASMLLPDGIFKSYPQSLVDKRDFAGMDQWLRTIYDDNIKPPPNAPDREHETVDDWLASLDDRGIHVVYSSGTSGNLSFVPRDAYSWWLFREGPQYYAPLLLARRGIVGQVKSSLAALAGRTLPATRFRQISDRFGFRDFDGIFLNFSGGNQGTQLVGQELAKRVRKANFLYPTNISATAIRALTRGHASPADRARTEAFLDVTVQRKEENYERMIRATRTAIDDGQRLTIFGAPYSVKEFCDRILAGGKPMLLPAGSIVGYGGGWKSFDGEVLSEPALIDLIERATGVKKQFVIDGYSMTEIGAIMLKCEHDRFHVPPHLETIILDDALDPVDGNDVTGILGVMDPFAVSYPGFLITGDNVHRTRNPCPCGLGGETLLSISRASGAEVKGCGGIMATVNA